MNTPDVTAQPEPPTAVRSSDLLGDLVEFIEGKLAAAESALKSREEMEKCWKGGTDESWRAAGCKLSRVARLHESATQGRIAARLRHEVQMFKAVLNAIKSPNAEVSDGGTLTHESPAAQSRRSLH